jgi:hypothetical protein
VEDATNGSDIALLLYPNPVAGRQIRILHPGPAGLGFGDIRLMGLDGRRIASLTDDGDAVTLPEGLPAGQYTISFSVQDDRRIARRFTVVR